MASIWRTFPMVLQSVGHDDDVFVDVHPDCTWLNSADDRWIYDDLIEKKKRIHNLSRRRRGWLTVIGHDWSHFISSKIRNRNVRWSSRIGMRSVMISRYREWVGWNSTQWVGHRLAFDDKNLEDEELHRSITGTTTLTKHVWSRSTKERERVARWIFRCKRTTLKRSEANTDLYTRCIRFFLKTYSSEYLNDDGALLVKRAERST